MASAVVVKLPITASQVDIIIIPKKVRNAGTLIVRIIGFLPYGEKWVPVVVYRKYLKSSLTQCALGYKKDWISPDRLRALFSE